MLLLTMSITSIAVVIKVDYINDINQISGSPP